MASQTIRQKSSLRAALWNTHSNFKAFKLKYLGPVEVIILVAALQ